MVCDICQKKEATVHLTEIINDKVTKMHLCEECAKEKGDQMETQFGLSDLLAGLADFGAMPETKVNKGMKCPACGFTIADFQSIGRLGCPKCYDTFAEQLSPLMRRIHGSDRHMGKMPVKTVKGKINKEAIDLKELKVKLQKAISLEAFEEAASLRDKIKTLEKNLHQKESD